MAGHRTDYYNPFTPGGKGSRFAATTMSQSLLLSAVGASQLQVSNESSSWAYVNTGISTVGSTTASAGTSGQSTTDYPVAPGAVVVITLASQIDTAAVVLESGTGVVICTPGMGN